MASPSDDTPPPPHRRRRWVPWTIAAGVILVLLGAGGWVASRALAARSELVDAEQSAKSMASLAASGDKAALAAAGDSFADHAARARAATGDPVWRAAELVPWLGANLVAVRQISEIADDVGTGAVPQLIGVADVLDPAALAPRDGAINTAPLSAAAPALHEASQTLTDAAARADALPTGTIEPITDAVGQLADATRQAATAVDTLDRVATLLPGMLGASGPRTYLLLMLNNAESRTQGGIPGALALLHAENGRLSLVSAASSADVSVAASPVIPLSDATLALFDELPARYIQDVTMPIDVSEGGRAAKALWENTHGGSVDGVISMDVPAASYLLAATGPVDAGGLSVNGDNAVETLLSTAYRQVPNPQLLDAAYGALAGAIFHAALSSSTDPRALVQALARATDENRLHVWSASDQEEAVLDGTKLGTLLPADSGSSRSVGVFVDDGSGGKLDYYATSTVSVATATCGGAPHVRVSVDWTNGTPADALTSLPAYVLIGSSNGKTRTALTIAGPQGWTPVSYGVDGEKGSSRTALLNDRVAIQQTFSTPFQGTRRVVVEFAGPAGSDAGAPSVVATPMVTPMSISSVPFTCGSDAPTPASTPAG